MRNPPPHLNLKIGTKSVSFVSSAKVLGIWLQDFKCDSQIEHLCKNAYKHLFMLHTLKRFVFNISELITVYCGYIRPIIEYTDVIWHSSQLLRNKLRLCRVFKEGPVESSWVMSMSHMLMPLKYVILIFCLLGQRFTVWIVLIPCQNLSALKCLSPPAGRRFMADSWEMASRSLNCVRAPTDLLKALCPTTLACLILQSLSSCSWWLLCCTLLLGGFDLFSCLPLLNFCFCFVFCMYTFLWCNSAPMLC